ncbi:MAG: carbohydrate-binding module family 20 domain-containing protein [Candidatus Eisenbacteria bacterium]
MRKILACWIAPAALFALIGAAAAEPEPVESGIHFTFRAPGASSVNLAGEMNAWSATATPMEREGDLWSVVVPLSPGVYRYKFVVDGNNWKEDPENPTKVDDNYGGFNSLLVVKPDGTVSFDEEDREIRLGDDYPGDKGTLYLNIIWHQHQPLYLDPAKDELQGPWVRAHGTKDYYDMAAILEAYPDVHYNVNLTSVLLFQLQSYYVERLGPFVDPVANRVDAAAFLAKWRGKTDPWIDLALAPAEGFGEREDGLLHKNAWNCFGFSDVAIKRFPEYHALREKDGSYTVDEKRAIKCWFYLAWFDPDFMRGPVALPEGWVVDLSDLVSEKEDGTFRLRAPFTEETANRLVAETYKVLASIVPIHKKLLYDPAGREGQIEVLTTPYYHPILPLIHDTEVARACQPNDPMPERFSHPEDAGAQVVKAARFYEGLFGTRPRGMWPGEGSVSESIVPVLAESGILWMASADHVLGRSSPAGMPLWRPYRIEAEEGGRSGTVAVVFRETGLSDRIGFRYQRLFGEEAADDFIRELFRYAPEPGEGEDRLLTVILDGENAWEWYVRDNDGKEFLHALYRKLSKLYDERKIVTVTVSEYIEGNPKRSVPAHPIAEMAALEALWPGSWVDGTFSTWIGEREENAAWDLLKKTRDFLGASGIPAPDPGAPLPPPGDPSHHATMAWEEMYAAEGSDWFWWYGSDQNAPGGDEPFDRAFLTHIENVYRYAIDAGAAMEMPKEFPSLLGGGAVRREAGGAMARGSGETVPVLFTCDAAGRKVSDAIYIVGDRPELAEWTPNKVRMYDDGTQGDEKAGDGIWSAAFEFPAGSRVEYKYTDSGAEGVWSPSEEFPVENRAVDVRPAAGEARVVTRDVFGTKEAAPPAPRAVEAPAGGGARIPVLFTCDAAGRKVADAIYIVGNQTELADWTPNKVRMYDDGTHGDEEAGDGIWSVTLEFPAGTRVEYKYTDSGAVGSWSPSEEFPVDNRALDVRLAPGAERVTTKDRFGIR